MNDIAHTQIGDVDDSTQNLVNKPPVDPTGFDPGVLEFVQGIMRNVFDSEHPLDLMVPATVIKQDLYSAASEEIQGKADLVAMSICAKLRDIEGLMQISGGDQLHIEPTYQVQALVADLKYRVETFEGQHGDMFII